MLGFDTTFQEDKARGIPMGKSFKIYLKEQFETLLNERLAEDKQRFENLSEVKIADIIFAFNNSELI